MKLVRLTKIQLAVFAVITILSITYALWNYGGLQRATGIGTYTVKAEFANAGGLYKRAIVTYRGSDAGVVTDIDISPRGAVATLQIESDHRIPKRVRASILSVSAIGEQYVDLVPDTADGPYLVDGDSLGLDRTTAPTSVNALMRSADDLLTSIPHDDLESLVDDSHSALAGTGEPINTLIGSMRSFVDLAQGSLPETLTLIEDGEPVLDSLNTTSAAITGYSRDLASFTEQLTLNDGQLRVLLDRGPAFADTVSETLDENNDTLPLLLSDLQSVSQVMKVNVPGIRQILVIYPALASSVNYAVKDYQQDGDLLKAQAGLDVKLGNTLIPPPCTNGYQSTERRDPSITTDGPSAYGARCVLPKSDPRAVRGSRNLPCATDPSVRTAKVENCPGGPPSQWPETRSGSADASPEPAARQRRQSPAREPLSAAYDPASGRAVLPDGTQLVIPGLAKHDTPAPADLRSLLLGGTR